MKTPNCPLSHRDARMQFLLDISRDSMASHLLRRQKLSNLSIPRQKTIQLAVERTTTPGPAPRTPGKRPAHETSDQPGKKKQKRCQQCPAKRGRQYPLALNAERLYAENMQ
ncbi:hypothetical protein ElyMa_002047300 [Elysia marginata]|uniref:Uncharacterized protein n=1 Tax=Elysia marginata TaxID=1093978 RepID=A0AAV4F7K1_9GAST|nr:hypothetical protein ElyMa_002047300 [Elysia marginata]